MKRKPIDIDALVAEAVPMRPNKYKAKKTVVDGIKFASKREAARYKDLLVLERAGQIACLELQHVYHLIVNGVNLGKYIADFLYIENGSVVVEDAKGFKTPVYRLKKKLMFALYGVQIRET